MDAELTTRTRRRITAFALLCSLIEFQAYRRPSSGVFRAGSWQPSFALTARSLRQNLLAEFTAVRDQGAQIANHFIFRRFREESSASLRLCVSISLCMVLMRRNCMSTALIRLTQRRGDAEKPQFRGRRNAAGAAWYCWPAPRPGFRRRHVRARRQSDAGPVPERRRSGAGGRCPRGAAWSRVSHARVRDSQRCCS